MAPPLRAKVKSLAPNKDIDKWVSDTIKANMNKNFVQRIAEPDKWPKLYMGKDPEGHDTHATHLMSWANVGPGGKKRIVYPNVVYDTKHKTLTHMRPEKAVKYAEKSGEYIEFPDDASAERFSTEYKRYWKRK